MVVFFSAIDMNGEDVGFCQECVAVDELAFVIVFEIEFTMCEEVMIDDAYTHGVCDLCDASADASHAEDAEYHGVELAAYVLLA